ncbi:hypothetical protein [Rasiella sp. SM2506]|uniref:hypothetical protein n=1 Tax=Rasiella sp. SM2506 TaxID=3423914 RepID=UPI003D7BEEF0
MKDQDQIIQEEMRKLIKRSCQFTENLSKDYYGFQKSLIKFYFGAIDVVIDFDKETILLWNSKPRTPKDYNLYDINEAVATKISYSNLEETLKGCLEKGDMQTRFYKTMLFHYSRVEENSAMPVSA